MSHYCFTCREIGPGCRCSRLGQWKETKEVESELSKTRCSYVNNQTGQRCGGARIQDSIFCYNHAVGITEESMRKDHPTDKRRCIYIDEQTGVRCEEPKSLNSHFCTAHTALTREPLEIQQNPDAIRVLASEFSDERTRLQLHMDFHITREARVLTANGSDPRYPKGMALTRYASSINFLGITLFGESWTSPENADEDLLRAIRSWRTKTDIPYPYPR